MEETEQKLDKRTKQYKDQNPTEIDVLRAEMLEMKETMKTMGQVTVNNSKAIKTNEKKKGRKSGVIVRPRAAELAVLKDFLEQFQGQLSYDKDLCKKIALNTTHRPNVDALNELIKKQSELHKKAIEVGLYENDDFKTIKINNK